MKERIANLFLLIDKQRRIFGIGARWHERDGSDDEKLAFLQSRVNEDLKRCVRYSLPDSIFTVTGTRVNRTNKLDYDAWLILAERNLHMRILEDTVFKKCEPVPQQPLMVITCVIEGKIVIQAHADMQGKITDVMN